MEALNKKIFFLGLLWLSTLTSQAQSKKEAFETICALKRGILIVLVETKQNKIEALENAKVQRPKDQSIDAALIELRERKVKESNELRKAFDSVYQFSEVLFAPDSVLKHIHEKAPSAFYNEKWELEPRSLDGKPYFFFYRGKTQTIGMEAYIIGDSLGKDLKAPFPYYVKQSNTTNSFLNFFDKFKDANRKIEKIVQKLQSRLESFYRKVPNDQRA